MATGEVTRIVDGGTHKVKANDGTEHTLGSIILFVSVNEAKPIPIIGYFKPYLHDTILKNFSPKRISWVKTESRDEEPHPPEDPQPETEQAAPPEEPENTEVKINNEEKGNG
ncbi:MAG: hypothetical protein ABFD76_05000 [Smithella sp.]